MTNRPNGYRARIARRQVIRLVARNSTAYRAILPRLRSPLKLNHLRDAVAVAEHGSLRAAARHLGVVQPQITRSIREIEQELGAALFERHAKGVRLTEIGQAFVRRASAVHSELRRAREEVEQLKGRDTGEVSVSLSSSSSLGLLPSAMVAFRKRHPQAVLRISENFFQASEAEILSGIVDFYVGPLDLQTVSRQFAVERLFDNRRLVLARKGHALAGARRIADLADAEWIRPLLAGGSTGSDFDMFFREQGLLTPRVALHARSALVTLLAVANTDLLTILPQQWVESPVVANMVAPVLLDQPLPEVPICIVRRRDLPLTPLAEAFCDIMRRAASAYAYRRDQKGFSG